MDKALLGSVKDSIVQGFQWGTREGPLCDERKSLESQSVSSVNLVLPYKAKKMHPMIFILIPTVN